MAIACLLALLAWAPGASADVDFCPPGSGAGECANPIGLNNLRGLALDFETGKLYVADRENNRVDVFEEDGTFLFAFGWGVDTGAAKLEKCTTASTCQAGIAGSGAGQLNKPSRIAVDNDPASPSRHAIYVAEDANHRVQKFGAGGELLGSVGSSGEAEGQLTKNISVGVGPGGTLYVLDNLTVGTSGLVFKHRLQRFKPDGEEIAPQCTAFEGGAATSLAVEASGDFWVSNQGTGAGIRKYDVACVPLLPEALEAGVEINLLSIDAAGDLFSAQSEGSYRVLAAYDASGAILRRFGYGRIPSPSGQKPEGLAVSPAGAFLSLGAAEIGVRRLEFPPPPLSLPPAGPIAAPSSVEVVKVGGARATATAEINPEGKATQIQVEYLTQADYEAQGNSFVGPATKSTDPEPLGAEGFRLQSKEFPIGCPDPGSESDLPGNGCLDPETEYRFRVIATNPDGGGEGTVDGGAFTTRPSPELAGAYATAVGTDTAHLAGEVDPWGHPTVGYFEYVDDARFQASGFAEAQKAPDVDAGQAPLDFGAGEEEVVTRKATLYPLSPGTVYHYRFVAVNPSTSAVTGSAQAFRTFAAPSSESCPNEASRIGLAALLPDCRAYELVTPLDKGGADIRVLPETDELAPAVLEQSALSGDRLAFGSVRAFGDSVSAPFTSQYVAQRVAGQEWETHSIDSPREETFGAGVFSQTDTEFKFFSPDLCNAWQTTVAEPPLGEGGLRGLAGFSNLYRRSDRLCGPEGYEALAPIVAPLTAPGSLFVLELQGVSGDGTHAIFRANGRLATGGTAGQRQLYESVRGAPPRFVCVLPNGKPLGGPCTAGSSFNTNGRSSNVTGAISEDGQRIYWSEADIGEGEIYVRIGGTQTVDVSKAAQNQAGTNRSLFWGASADGARAIFTTDPSSGSGNMDLYEFTLDGKSTQLIAERVVGVMGMSKDAQRVYFASREEIEGEGEPGKPNLYLYEAGKGGGSTTFIATLADGDLGERESPLSPEPLTHTARVSPDGLHAAFVSLASPTGYDNHDAATGELDREVYLYDASTGKLVCASCNPSVGRPAGGTVEANARFAARIPAFETSMHAANVLSDNGTRLYFESADALTPRDSNGKVDVYQWEAPGPNCSTSSSSSYSPQDGGCVDLISSGQSAVDSRFVEATPSGDDVFFATLSSLVPQDPGLVDIYDARVDGGLPIPQAPPPSCEGEACQGPVSPPNDPTPASSNFQGAGNVKEGVAKKKVPPKKCAKGKVRKGKKCIKKKAGHTKHAGDGKKASGRGQKKAHRAKPGRAG